MKHVKTFALFENETTLTKRQIKFLDTRTKGSWSVNPTTGLVDVKGDFDCSSRRLKTLLGIKFGVVSGDFYCYQNQLTSLEGAPREVGKNFHCINNKLTSLEGAPREVSGDFLCYKNQLTSLEGAPQRVGGNFWCSKNKLTSLEGAPQEVGGNFDCSNNQLTSLEGAPREVGGNFYCTNNQLTSLEGAPQEVGGNFSCYGDKLTSLKGAPEKVEGIFYLGNFSRFKWTTEGKLEYLTKNPEWAPLIAPTLPYDSLLDVISETPTLLKTIEDFDKVLYNKVLKGLGWDKMGPDLLRQLKNGML